jgi:hypothetical protein
MRYVRLEPGASGTLYVAEPAGGASWSGYFLPAGAFEGDPPEALEPEAAWSSYWGNPRREVNGGCYLFCASPPPTGTAEALGTLLRSLNAEPEFRGFAYRFLIWIAAPATLPLEATARVPFAEASSSTVGGVLKSTALALRTLLLNCEEGLTLAYDAAAEALTLAPEGRPRLRLTQTITSPASEVGKVTGTARLPLAGADAGRLTLPADLTIQEGLGEDDLDRLGAGVRYTYATAKVVKSQLFRLIEVPERSGAVAFEIDLDPLHATDETRTRFTFHGDAGAYSSPLRTITGAPLTLTPVVDSSGLVLAADRVTGTAGEQIDSYYATLAGPFVIGGPAGPQRLLCGLSGLENVAVNPAGGGYEGDRLVFHPAHAAHAPVFPPSSAELDAKSREGLEKPLLDETMTTAWATLEAAASQPARNAYFAQAQGAPLFANDGADGAGMLDLLDEPVGQVAAPFPLAAYQGAKVSPGQDGFAPADLALFEQAAIAPSRRATIGPRALEADAAELDGAAAGAATPQGFLVELAGATWSSLLIADTDPGGSGREGQLSFSPVDPNLQAALQTGQLFLVATKPLSGFAGAIDIEEWPFDLAVGKDQAFGSYSNVLLFKFCDGTLADLVGDPRRWTAAETFNEEAEGGLLALSKWLQGYLKDAAASTDPALENFNAIAADPNWKGVLALRVDVPLDQLPAQVSALRCGIDTTTLSAHHLGVEVNQLTPDGRRLQGPSSLFGLIDYTDPTYAKQIALGAAATTPVPPAPGLTYDFKVLRLLVLFANSEVKLFRSISQVTLGEWFGDPVIPPAAGGAPQTAIVILGALQHHNGQPVYVFSAASGTTFPLESKVLPSVTVATASLETVKVGGEKEASTYRFPFSGSLEFGELKELDPLSFSALAFQDVALEMIFDREAAVPRTFRFTIERAALDAGTSVWRPQSLYAALPLTLRGLTSGTGSPTGLGYAGVKLSGAPVSALGQQWYGFTLDLDLGTPGALAAAAGWSATLLIAWGPGSKRTEPAPPRAAAGMRLPGASGGGKTLSLQGVLSLSVEDIQLARAKPEPPQTGAYMLRLTNIALSLLGLKFPPGYGTAFYLFGNPAATTERSSLGWYAALAKT